jgi:glutamine phosphoribosylpyrophosphate amidotransferase
MKLEQLTENADNINNLKELNSIMQQPRQGRIYVYHQGMVANDKVLDKKMSEEKIKKTKELSNISHFVNRYAEKNELMSFQKRMKDGRFLYFFVR